MTFRLQPLLTEVKKDRKTIAMAVLDYVNAENFEYYFYESHLPRYGFEWKLGFFETFFRKDQIGATEEDARPYVSLIRNITSIIRIKLELYLE